MNEILFENINVYLLEKNENEIKNLLNVVLEKNGIKSSVDNIDEIFSNMKKYIQDSSAIIIGALKNDKLIGFIWGYKLIVNLETRIHINYFVVNEGYRKHGIGNKLITELYKLARKENIKKVELMVTAKNEIATDFYKKQGFEIERVKLCKEI